MRETVDPFEHLVREHGLIETVLRVIDVLSDRAHAQQDVDRQDLRAAMDYLTDFEELGHHEKEEVILTPVLIANGFDWYQGPLASVRRDHRQEHYFIRVLGQLAHQPESWSSEDLRRFVSVAREFTAFLRGHMGREQHDLFGLARQMLPAAEQEAMLAAFARFDSEPERVPALANLEQQRRQLLDKYGIA